MINFFNADSYLIKNKNFTLFKQLLIDCVINNKLAINN